MKIYPIHNLIAELSKQLEVCCKPYEAAVQEAWWLLEKLTKTTKPMLFALGSIQLSDEQQTTLDAWVSQRVVEKKPLQYILGSVPFCDLEIIVQPPILIPRPETEEWVTWLIDDLKLVKNNPLKILDLCTGSGCIALALGKAFPQSMVVGIDINPLSIALAQKNKEHNAITNVTFLLSDLDRELDPSDRFDLIVSNPPYLTGQEYDQLEPEVKQWEDQYALVAPDDGLNFYKRIAQLAPLRLNKSTNFVGYGLPRVVVEVGSHIEPVKSAFERCNLRDIRSYRDMQGVMRWVVAYLT